MEKILLKQRAFFGTHTTRDIDFRKKQLKKLESAIGKFQNEILDALKLDLNKSNAESYMSEISIIKDELKLSIKNVKKWAAPKSVSSTLTTFPASSQMHPEPLGVVLIISPWNYPFQLTLAPLIAAIAAGNCVIVKPSEFSINTSAVLEKLIKDTFNEEYVSLINGGVSASKELLALKFDYIFFTGSTAVGKIVMQAAANYLTPVTLELGGKSPTIVAKDANIKIAAKRIIWGKCLNSGQTCIAPDYAFVHTSVKSKFIDECIKQVKKFFGDNPISNDEYPKIISEKHFERLQTLLDENRTNIVYGGKAIQAKNQIEPTLITLPFSKESFAKQIMQDEIFGPILPIIEFENIGDVILEINSKPKPLSLYLFTSSSCLADNIINSTSSGGVCINDVIMHVANHNLPFGGVGASGMGSYHGKFGFDTFSHNKSVLANKTFIDIPLRYPPYQDKFELIKLIMK